MVCVELRENRIGLVCAAASGFQNVCRGVLWHTRVTPARPAANDRTAQPVFGILGLWECAGIM